MADDTNTAERDAFEAHCLRTGHSSTSLGKWGEKDDVPTSMRGDYIMRNIQNAWLAFQAGRASLAASEGSEPVAEIGSAAGDDAEFGQRAIYPLVDIGHLEYGTKLYTHPSPPEGMVAVPKEFIRAFSDTAHNYQLSVEPPDHFSGTEGDAFRAAYARCGVELLRLRGILIGPLPASEAKEL